MADPQQYDTSQLDTVEHPTLGTLHFPRAMPPEERNASIDKMLSTRSPSEADQGSELNRKAVASARATIAKPLNIAAHGTPEDQASEKEMLDNGDILGLSTSLGQGAKVAESKRDAAEVTNLTHPNAKQNAAGYDFMGRALRMASGATSGQGIATGLAAAGAPEVVGPALVGHGLFSALKHSPGAIKGNPEEAQSSLSGLAEAAGGATASMSSLGPKTAALRTSLAEKSVSPLVYENVGETAADTRMGVNPERALTREGLVGSKKSIASQAATRTAELKTAANQIIQNHANANVQLDAEPIIDAAIDKAIESSEKTASGTKHLEDLRTALKTKYGKLQGTPLEMNNLKSDIQDAAANQGAYKNTQPVEASKAAAMSDAARGIKDKVNETIPEAQPLNERMADLFDARRGLERSIAADKGRSSFGGFHEGAASRMLNNTLGSAPMRTGIARALMTGLTKDVPAPIPTRATPFTPPQIPPEILNQLARRMAKAPPKISPQFAQEAVGGARNADLLGTRGQGGVRITPKGLLPAPASFEPPAPVPQVGQMPPAGFPPHTPNPMWEGGQPKSGFDTAHPVDLTPGKPSFPSGIRGLSDAQIKGLVSRIREQILEGGSKQKPNY